MNSIITNNLLKGIVLSLLVLITPLLVLGDVHLAHQSHPCEVDHQSYIDDLPWHPHGACASDIEKDHFDLKSLIQKSSNIDAYELPVVPCEILVHDHSECQRATQIVDSSSYSAEDIFNVLSVFLI